MAKCLETNSKCETLLPESKRFLKLKQYPWLSGILKNEFSVHCVIHRHHLFANNLSEILHGSLDYVISAVNKIKRNALNERLFTQHCLENEEDYKRVLIHTEIRWLSKSA